MFCISGRNPFDLGLGKLCQRRPFIRKPVSMCPNLNVDVHTLSPA